VDGRSDGHPRTRAPEGRRPRRRRRRAAARSPATTKQRLPATKTRGNDIYAKLGTSRAQTRACTGGKRRRPRRASMGADGRRPAKRRRRYGQAQMKRRAGIGSLRRVGALVGGNWMEKRRRRRSTPATELHGRRRRAAPGVLEGLRVQYDAPVSSYVRRGND
jgi:hypothetical protein